MVRPVKLSHNNLALLPAGIGRPAYVPDNVRPGIVHLGLGGFHRAHMARYTHDLMDIQPDALHWGIIGVGLMPSDRGMRDALAPQDGLYALVERQDDIESATVIGSICDVIFAGESSKMALEAITSPTTRIVSLTVTENGYCLNPATKQLDFAHPSIVHDLTHPELPRSAVGIIVEAYRRRMVAGLPAMTALTCDNIQHNGAVLRGTVLALAQRRDPLVARWIEANASFPNTMVDRITPATTADDTSDFASRYGVADRWPVFSERFRQWVIEDQFVQGRPAWETVGAQFADDVAPYEFMKLRLLNASHLAIAGLGRLAGYNYIDEALRDGSFRAYMQALMDRETGPTIPAVPGIDMTAYKAQLLDRFANSKIEDTVERVNSDAPINLLIDPIRDRLKKNADAPLLALALAAWMRRVRGEDEGRQPIHVVHPAADLLRARAIEGGTDPRPLLAINALFGELIDNQPFVSALERWLGLLYGRGAKATLAHARRELDF
jgi:mannitol 2-dehydrogenase